MCLFIDPTCLLLIPTWKERFEVFKNLTSSQNNFIGPHPVGISSLISNFAKNIVANSVLHNYFDNKVIIGSLY